MKRFNYAFVCYGATLAIVIAIALLPLSSWAFKNHVDILTGGWQDSNTPDQDWVEPTRLTGGSAFSANFKVNAAEKYPVGQSFAAIVENAHDHSSDPASLAHLIRYNFLAAHKVGDKEPAILWPGHVMKDVREEAMWAARRGEERDPNNAYFPSSQAVLLNWSGKTPEAYEALKRAAACRRFDEYAQEEGIDRYNGMLERAGYRGEKARTMYLASVLLPHFAVYKLYATELRARPQTRETVQAEADFMRVSEVMEQTDPYTIGVLVGVSLTQVLLKPPVSEQTKGSPISDAWDSSLAPFAAKFNALQKEIGVERPFDPSRLVQNRARLRGVEWTPPDDPITVPLSKAATLPAPTLLIGVITAVLFAALTFKMRPGAEWPRRLLPYVGASAVLWMISKSCNDYVLSMSTPEFYWGVPVPHLSTLVPVFSIAMLGLGLLQLIKPLRSFVTIVGLLLSMGILLWTFPIPELIVAPITFVALLGAKRVHWRVPYVLQVASLLALCIGCGWLVTGMAIDRSAFVGCLLAAVFVTCSLFFANGSRRLLVVAPAATLLISIGYLGAVITEIRQNQEMKVELDNWSKEADLMRAKMGITSRS